MKEFGSKMKEIWSNLSLRDKKMALLGSAVVGTFIIYQCMWAPYTNYVEELRHRIDKNQNLLDWMIAADNVMRRQDRKARPHTQLTSPILLLGFLQKQISLAGLEPNLVQLKQSSNESVEMHFQKVDFDKLIRMLTSILKEGNVSIAQLSATAESAPGVVNSDIILQLAPAI